MRNIFLFILLLPACMPAWCEEITKLSKKPPSSSSYSLSLIRPQTNSVVFGFENEEKYYSLEIQDKQVRLKKTAHGATSIVFTEKITIAESINSVLLKIRKQNISLYINNLYLTSKTLPELTAQGKYGIQGTYKDFKLLPCIEPRFMDDFERRSKNNVWEIIRGKWDIKKPPHSELSISPYQYSGTGKQGLSVAGNDLWDNYLFSASVLLGAENAKAGLVFYRISADSLYRLIYNGTHLHLDKLQNGRTTILKKEKLKLSPHSWHRFSVLCRDNKVTVYINGVNMFSYEALSFPSGKAGLWVDSKSDVFFDDIEVTPARVVKDPAEYSMKISENPLIPLHFKQDQHMQNWVKSPVLKLGKEPGSVLDFTFFMQPVNWEFAQGLWGVESRWTCTPEFTLFCGTPDSKDRPYTIWLKRRISGNFKIKLFTAIKMKERALPFYDFPFNVNITLSSKIGNFSDDYTLSFGGPDIPSRIIQGAAVKAESSKIVEKNIRKNYDRIMKIFHYDWIESSFEKNEDTLSIYSPRGKIVTYRIDNRVDRPYLCLWGSDIGISIARIQTVFTKAELLTRKELEILADAQPVREELIHTIYSGYEDLNRSITKLLHERPVTLVEDNTVPELSQFFHKKIFTKPFTPQSPMMYDSASVFKEDKEGEFMISNTNLGGDFEVILVQEKFHPSSYPILSFDYKLPQQLPLTLQAYFENGQIMKHKLGIKSNNKWHTYRLNIGAKLKHTKSPLIKLTLKHDSPYSNVQGDCYYLRNISLQSSIPFIEKEKDIDIGGNIKIKRYAKDLYVITSRDRTRIPVSIQKQPENASSESEAVIELYDAGGLQVSLKPDQMHRLDFATAVFTVNDRTYRFGASTMHVEYKTGILRLDFNKEKIGITGSRIRAGFCAYTFSGSKLSGSKTFDAPQDKQGPSIISVYPLYEGHLVHEDFSKDRSDYFAPLIPSNFRRGRVLYVNDPDPHLEYLAAGPGRYEYGSAYLIKNRFNFKKFPLLTFRYKSRNKCYFQFQIQKDNSFIDLSAPKGTKMDGQWHTMQIDLSKRFKHSVSDTINYIYFKIHNSDRLSQRLCIDDVQLSSKKSKHITFLVTPSHDISGIAGYSWILDTNKKTEPSQKITSKTNEFKVKNPKKKNFYFHVRACDNKGNWGKTYHFPLTFQNY